MMNFPPTGDLLPHRLRVQPPIGF